MAKKSVGGTGKGLIGGSGVMGTPTAKNYGGVLNRSGKGLTGGKGVFGTKTAANYGGVLTRNKPRSVVGGLGMQAFGTSKQRPIEFRTPKTATTATRNYQYGNVLAPTPAAAPAPIKAQVKPGDVVKKAVGAVKSKAADVVRTVTNMKNSPTPKRGTNLGVSSGKTTGTSVSRGGTGGRTTGGGRSTGGGYSNAGPAGMGASGRGTGGKR